MPDTVLGTGNTTVYKSIAVLTEFIAHQGRWTIKQAITTDSLKDHNTVTAVNLIKPPRHCFGIEYARLDITQPTGIRKSSTTKRYSSKKINLKIIRIAQFQQI